MDLHIRPIRLEDSAALYEIRRQPEVQKFTTAMPTERQVDFFGRLGAHDHVLVAELDGRVVGVAGLHGKEGKFRHAAGVGIAVHDAFAGRGVGRALMERIVDVADNWLNLVRVELEVFADNERAKRLYERLGFVEEGRKRKAVFRAGQYIDELLMARVR
jgi:L-phenylalanine/L-methionine N-acetyltransferase